MTKVQILTTCVHCNGQAYLPVGQAVSAKGETYTRHIACPICEGSGLTTRWITLQELSTLLSQARCQHLHTSFRGSMHITGGDVWDDIHEVCDDCGASLKPQIVGDFINDPA